MEANTVQFSVGFLQLIIGSIVGVFAIIASSFAAGSYLSQFVKQSSCNGLTTKMFERIDAMFRKLDKFGNSLSYIKGKVDINDVD